MTDHRLRANRKLEGQPCRACGAPLAFGDETVVCDACQAPYHGACWQGCACVAPPPVAQTCPRCGEDSPLDAEVCDHCHAVLTADGVYHGPVTTAPGAVASLVFALVGSLFLGPVLGLVAVVLAREARATIRLDPRYGGAGLAMAGLVLGLVDIAVHSVVYILRLRS